MRIHKIVMLGNKDHGKSTLIGNMLMLTKSISQERIDEAKRISRALGIPFEPGFLLDSFSDEREKAMTIDTSRAQLVYKNSAFELIDVPGHEELITNMLTGASSAGTAVLMVSAKHGEGISKQTKRHLLIAMMLGMRNIVVAVNKMDSEGYKIESFGEVRNRLSAFISSAHESMGAVNAEFVPISAYNGDNLISKSENMEWYGGPTLMELIYRYATGTGKRRDIGLRAVVQGEMQGNGLACKVVSGRLFTGQRVAVNPGRLLCTVNRIIRAGRSVPQAGAGASPVINLSPYSIMQRGGVISEATDMPMVGRNFSAFIFLSRIPKNPSIKINGAEAKCHIRIGRELDINTGRLKEGRAVSLGIYRASIKTLDELAFEKFNTLTELGRFTIYDSAGFSGLGIII